MSASEPLDSMGGCDGRAWRGAYAHAAQKRGLELAKPTPFKVAGKQACLLFWEETLAPSSKDASYTNILEKRLWNKRQSAPYS